MSTSFDHLHPLHPLEVREGRAYVSRSWQNVVVVVAVRGADVMFRPLGGAQPYADSIKKFVEKYASLPTGAVNDLDLLEMVETAAVHVREAEHLALNREDPNQIARHVWLNKHQQLLRRLATTLPGEYVDDLDPQDGEK